MTGQPRDVLIVGSSGVIVGKFLPMVGQHHHLIVRTAARHLLEQVAKRQRQTMIIVLEQVGTEPVVDDKTRGVIDLVEAVRVDC